ncbi:MAG TPA: helix-turn-helix domain-containing protein [Saprospiraceae bacterium]|nr:MAG: AraC family transcriptional regulator [Candidatus Parvibacillus calidus]HMZ24443.1 helix-turn-helix domain-containing protein [Saprospiraceae bacterium]HNB61221.1 helix-turn-helix domain-containing protein [Saprospiraceae bacterium]HQP75973.1 helix-turn-helix domain-containing protein [Saprospiraceae bacterium]
MRSSSILYICIYNRLYMLTLAWIGVSQGFFAAILMVAKQKNSVSDKILSAWLFLFGLDFLSCALDYMIFGKPLLTSSFLLFNPALYLYVKSLVLPRFRLRWTQLLHLLPYIIFKVLAYVYREPFTMEGYFERDGHLVYRLIFGASTIVSWLVYNSLTLKYVHLYRVKLFHEQSNIEKSNNLTWVLTVAVFYVSYCIIAFMMAVAAYIGWFGPLSPHIYNYFVLLFAIYILSFYGLYQQELPEHLLIEESVPVAYKNSSLSPEAKEDIRKRIEKFMIGQKPYLNPGLNMDMLSEALNIPKYQLTEVLNTVIGSNFFQYVNKFRVEAVKDMLLDPTNHFSIEAIGFECGFASKSSFYSVFKNMTGKTPIAFRESVVS